MSRAGMPSGISETNADGWLDTLLRYMKSASWPRESAISDAPDLQCVPKVIAVLLVKAGDNHFDDDLWGGLLVRAEIAAAMEIMLIDSLCACETIGSDCEFDGLKDSRFTGVIVAQKGGGAFEVKLGEP